MFFATSFSLAGLLLASGASAAIHDVQVGDANGNTVFNPEAIVRTKRSLSLLPRTYEFFQFADAGDQVIFHFQPKNHSVVQTSFAGPCSPKDGGFNSGFNPVPANQTDNFPTFTVVVNDVGSTCHL